MCREKKKSQNISLRLILPIAMNISCINVTNPASYFFLSLLSLAHSPFLIPNSRKVFFLFAFVCGDFFFAF